jgi:xylose isomerase
MSPPADWLPKGMFYMSARLTPVSEDKFAFGLWTIGHPGRDPFGDATRPPITPGDFVRGLGRIGAWGVSFHDNDLIPYGATAADANKIKADFRKALDETGVVVSMATTNPFFHPCFKDGAFTSNDPEVRRYAISKALNAIDIGAEFSAPTFVFWGGREGVESAASKYSLDALDRYSEALNYLSAYVKDQGYQMRFAIEPKPNEPRGDTFLPTIGHAMAFIQTLDDPSMVGLNPEVAHETMAGLSFYQGVAQAIWQEKLFHIDLNDQKIGRFDQDLRFGSEGVKDDFFLVRLLELTGYAGPKHFDSRPYRNEYRDGVWEFAANSMKTYLAFAAKARAFDADPAVQQATELAGVNALAKSTVGKFSTASASALKAETFDPEKLAARNYYNERLDQLVIDHIFGLNK